MPGGLPPTFGARVAALPSIARVTVVSGDNVWLTGSETKAGTVVDQPTVPNLIPIDAIAVDPPTYASFLPAGNRAVVADLRKGEAILGRSSARLRGLGIGAVMHFQTGGSVTIIGILPDDLVGAAELVVNGATGRSIGIQHDRYLLMSPSPGTHPSAPALEGRLVQFLPTSMLYRMVRVRAPGQAAYLRAGDLVLPPVLIKRRFGEWTGRPDPVHPGYLELDPAWVQAHIVSTSIPLLGQVTCNKKLVPQLRGAMLDVQKRGLASTIHSFAGCYSARFVERQPDASISHHTWGIAVDINADTNAFGVTPTQDPRLVRIMRAWGFVWGGDFLVPDGMHFEYLRTPSRLSHG